MRVGMGHLERNANPELGATLRLGNDVDGSAEARDALSDPGEAEAPPRAGESGCRWIEATSIVADAADDLALGALDRERGAGGTRVARDIAERLLGDPIQRCFDGSSQSAAGGTLDRDGELRTSRQPLAEEAQCRNQAEVLEDGRAQLVRQTTKLVFDLVQSGGELFLPGTPRTRCSSPGTSSGETAGGGQGNSGDQGRAAKPKKPPQIGGGGQG